MGTDMMSDLVQIAISAGQAILEIYQKDFQVYEKADGSPLTDADLTSHRIISAGLQTHFPHLPIVSEEAATAAHPVRQEWREYFLIDPLDGTKEFLKRSGEFTVNIAFIRDGYPLEGVVYAPVFGLMFYTQEGKAFRIKDGKTLQITSQPHVMGRTLKVVASRSHLDPQTTSFIDKLKLNYSDIELISAGSSLKFCMIAEGTAHVYPRLAPTCEWDTAAATAVVEAAGGSVIDWETRNTPLRYNKENMMNPSFVVSAPGVQLG